MKKIMTLAVIMILVVGVFAACSSQSKTGSLKAEEEKEEVTKMAIDTDNLSEIWVAGGCFWGVEEYFSRIDGVHNVVSGYANGSTENPTYREVINGTGHAETVLIQYDSKIIDLEGLLTYYFRIINPFILNQQGLDIGVQYRTGIYYKSESDLETINRVMAHEQSKRDKLFVVEVLPLDGFYEAEEYHQDYLKKNPNGYCHIDFGNLDAPIEDVPGGE